MMPLPRISPASTTSCVVVSVSQAMRASGSFDRNRSTMASQIWSETLSGWPSRNRFGREEIDWNAWLFLMWRGKLRPLPCRYKAFLICCAASGRGGGAQSPPATSSSDDRSAQPVAEPREQRRRQRARAAAARSRRPCPCGTLREHARRRAPITAEMPVGVARTTGSPSSIARIRACARCCGGPQAPNQASFDGLNSSRGRCARSTTWPEKMIS